MFKSSWIIKVATSPPCNLHRLATHLHPAIPSHHAEMLGTDIVEVDTATLSLVEQVSLVRCQSRGDRDRLCEAVRLAMVLSQVDTKAVEPQYYTLEDEKCPVREDVPKLKHDCKSRLMKLPAMVEEDYFVTPGLQI